MGLPPGPSGSGPGPTLTGGQEGGCCLLHDALAGPAEGKDASQAGEGTPAPERPAKQPGGIGCGEGRGRERSQPPARSDVIAAPPDRTQVLLVEDDVDNALLIRKRLEPELDLTHVE